MKINWKLRFKNKATLAALLACIIAFLYQIFGILEIAVPVSERDTIQIITLLLNVFTAMGIVIDPTTSGISDSENALNYPAPK